MDGPEAARAALAALGARRTAERHFEDNLLFDDARGRLVASGRTLRLRRAGGKAVVTSKGPRRPRADRVKSRPETEVEVSDADAAEAILRDLGLRKVFRYQKYREAWRWRDVEIVVDETPIGT